MRMNSLMRAMTSSCYPHLFIDNKNPHLCGDFIFARVGEVFSVWIEMLSGAHGPVLERCTLSMFELGKYFISHPALQQKLGINESCYLSLMIVDVSLMFRVQKVFYFSPCVTTEVRDRNS